MTPKKQPDVYYCYDELPKWLQNNPFVHRRYRPPKESYAYCFKSVFMLHTETVNIWTHLVAFFIYLYMAVEFFRHQHCSGISGGDKILLSTAYFACAATWLMSTVYHIMICHSVSVCNFWFKMDILGIIVNFTVNTNILIYFAFYYQPMARYFHHIIMTCSGVWAGVWTMRQGNGLARLRQAFGVAVFWPNDKCTPFFCQCQDEF